MKGHIKRLMSEYIPIGDREGIRRVCELSGEGLDKAIEQYVDNHLAARKERLARIKAEETANQVTPKSKRPFCIATNETNGKQCQARQKWDRKTNKAVNGYCFTHQHLADKPSK